MLTNFCQLIDEQTCKRHVAKLRVSVYILDEIITPN